MLAAIAGIEVLKFVIYKVKKLENITFYKSYKTDKTLFQSFFWRLFFCRPDNSVDFVVEEGDGDEGQDAQHHEPDQHHVMRHGVSLVGGKVG